MSASHASSVHASFSCLLVGHWTEQTEITTACARLLLLPVAAVPWAGGLLQRYCFTFLAGCSNKEGRLASDLQLLRESGLPGVCGVGAVSFRGLACFLSPILTAGYFLSMVWGTSLLFETLAVL